VGISFGADRIYDVMEELNLFPESLSEAVKVLFISFDEPTFEYAFRCATALRAAGIPCEVYPEPGKLKKQFEFAAKRGVPYVAVAGETEMATGTLNVKNQSNGEQQSLDIASLTALLQ
jgi:histidyl-tRNA synthetase